MYRVFVEADVGAQIAALPASTRSELAGVLDAIGLAPWNGPPHHEKNPDGAVRHWLFGDYG